MDKLATVSKDVQTNRDVMAQLFHTDVNKDIVIRSIRTLSGTVCVLVFIDGMADGQTINDFIIRPLAHCRSENAQTLDYTNLIQTNSCTTTEQIEDAVEAVLNGDTAMFIDGQSTAYLCETKGFEHRSPTTPTTENTIKGSQEGFTETLRTNTTLMHRILKSRHLVTEMIQVGEVTAEQSPSCIWTIL